MDPAAATGQIRVAVIGDGAAADLALPTTLAIRELIPRIRATLASGCDHDELSPEDVSEDGLRPYSLAPLGGTPFSRDATLETLGHYDGEQLVLCKSPPGPAAPPVVEDIADAAAIHSARQFKPFRARHAACRRRRSVVLAVGALMCGLAVYGWHLGIQPMRPRLSTGHTGRRVHRRNGGATPTWATSQPPDVMGVATTVPLALTLAARCPVRAPHPGYFWPRRAGDVVTAVGDYHQVGSYPHRDHRRVSDRGSGGRGASRVAPAVPNVGVRRAGGVAASGPQRGHRVGGVGAVPVAQCARAGEPTPAPSVAG